MVSSAAALLAAVLTWVLGDRAMSAVLGPGYRPRMARGAPHEASPPSTALTTARPGGHLWLAQAGAGVSPGQFWAVSGGVGASGFVVLFAVCGAAPVAALSALACAAAPYGYWSSQRRRTAAARSGAWPDALRYMVGRLGAGLCTVHDALEDLAISGPVPLRAPMARACRLSSHLGDKRALETVRAELADPVSDPVLLVLAGAVEQGTATALHALSDIGDQIAADLALAERIRTVQAQSRAAVWGCFGLPYLVLVFLCSTNPVYRQYFSSRAGVVVLVLGAAMSCAGLAACRRLVRTPATLRRVFAGGVVP